MMADRNRFDDRREAELRLQAANAVLEASERVEDLSADMLYEHAATLLRCAADYLDPA